MSLTIREYSFFVLSLLAAVWFFVGYPTQDPRSSINLSLEKTEVEQKAKEAFGGFGFATQHYSSEVNFDAHRSLLDSLQKELGRSELIEKIKSGEIQNLKPFYWQVRFTPTTEGRSSIIGLAGTEDSNDGPPGENDEYIELRFDMQGELIEVRNPNAIIPNKAVNRPALGAAFGPGKDGIGELLSSLSDSSLSRQFGIDVQRSDIDTESVAQWSLERLETLLDEGGRVGLTEPGIFNITSYYLGQTGWDVTAFVKDTVRLGRTNGTNTANARFQGAQEEQGQKVRIDVSVTATGGLLSIESTYNPDGNGNTTFHELWPVLRTMLIFLFCLAGVIIFFFRIRARAIDTKPALVIAILAGVMVSVQMLLSTIVQTDIFTESTDLTTSILILVVTGVSGAAAALAFFVFSAIGDSITRQHWSEKLSLYNYIRQGMLFNKPVGYMLIRSVLCAFLLAGLWTLVLWLFPKMYLDIQQVFLHEQAMWPPIYIMFKNGAIALSVTLGVFLVLGGQAYAQTKNSIISSLFMVLACTIVVPIAGDYGPAIKEIGSASIVGIALVLIYLKWEVVTLLLSHFLFLGLLTSAGGWVVENSIDAYIFIFQMGLMASIFVAGVWTILKGKDEKVLTRFVPEYVEELAQEQRIKQELQIAREVQQSFLPIRTPEFEHLELAAICKPAYETGGDYYDFIPLDDNRVAVTIGDVSGKGIEAAFYMTFIKGILHSLCREIDSPAELLKKTNRLFYDNASRGIFISLVYGIVDLNKQEFHFARAGHNPILRMNTKESVIEELQPRGIGLGLSLGSPFDNQIEEVRLKLYDNDALVLYTDGITEALNEKGTFYGSHRLHNLLKKQSDKSASTILDTVSNDIKSYIGEAKQHDDMTMIVMKLKNKESGLLKE
ncbi:PP2C family protein-serine/threonine phosphatase [Aliifodinibius salicampi]|uniref:PP2C family protein-serine/threonine phosphatase n=1 Tax=Fodinibius salicampi TaxID=1920655 RepID=A0ABT3PZG3_9BACT|nr:PP2C family protein-serine/threonine phosphatase [Fodinibius salicampi]